MGNCHGCDGKESRRRLYAYKYNADTDLSKKYNKSPNQNKPKPIVGTNEIRDSQPATPVTAETKTPSEPTTPGTVRINTLSKESLDHILTSLSETIDDESESFDDNETEQKEGMDDDDDETVFIQATPNIKINNMHIQESHYQDQFLDVMMVKPNLFRPNTAADWDVSDIEDLEEDMAQELSALYLDHNQISSNSPTSMDSLSSQHLLLISHSSTNLIKNFSHDWDSDDMDVQEEGMRKCLVHLTSLQLAHENSKSSVLSSL
eukprot:CAMPEP_0201569332 /NCGR_PEP_ID=MMETSP0190_2-20130828/10963_1 /ASSEMBLY_ACC=CAM_ASM_000263 /TAXON_ID=37353 /ORGANISM="Rosalina sp." /LENGTH=261 /DNA_ID=CAMNT_0047991537 /DNA_START=40 /DNA_END=825 /DNA_ORIENTATION=-